MNPQISVLIPSYNRVNALIATLTSLTAQTFKDFEVVIADQSDLFVAEDLTVKAITRILELHGHRVNILANLPKKGIAQQRHYLLDHASAAYVLFMDNDVVLESDVIQRMYDALITEKVGFCGMALIGLSYLNDIRPHQQDIEFWTEKVVPEHIRPGSKEWNRFPLHNAANILHVARRFNLTAENQRKYKIAWVGGCILYDKQKLVETGGFNFWEQLPEEHCGEDVLAQLKLMEKYGGFGLLPSGAYHLELPTTIENRLINAPEYLLR